MGASTPVFQGDSPGGGVTGSGVIHVEVGHSRWRRVGGEVDAVPVEQVRAGLNPRLIIQGVVLTMFDPRNNLSGQVMADVKSFLGDKVYETVIPRNVRVSEAPSYGKPALLYDLRCSGSQAYLRLASEVIKRERALRAAA